MRTDLNVIKGFTLVEVMIVVLTISILAATATGAFTTYQYRTKATEAVAGLSKIVEGEFDYYQKNIVFLDAGPTNIPPSMNKVQANFAADTRWAALSFHFADAVYYGYQATTAVGSVDCDAIGDLDGDGITSLYRRTLSINADGQPQASNVYFFDELE